MKTFSEPLRRRTGTPSVALLPVISALFCIVAIAPALNGQSQTPSSVLKPELQPLSYFIGQWSCQGEFVATKKPISSRVSVSSDLDGSWLAFRWDDNAPNVFHALELWGFDKSANHFMNFIHDNFGGVRLFTAPGWGGETLTWTGNALPHPSLGERFVIERNSPKQFVISWEVHKPQAQQWTVGDRLTCRQQ